MKPTYDAVVIGSGFGGAITACRIAEAGHSVCILERGKRWPKEKFPRTTGQVAHAFWNERDYGFIDYDVFRNIDVIRASGVGGGSLVYFNVHLWAPKEIFEQREWPKSITLDSLTPYYERAKAMLEAKPLTPPEGRLMPPRTLAYQKAATRAQKDPRLVDIAVYTGPDRNNPYGGVPQSACVYCGNCMLGCHVHAKNTLDLNYIPLAEKHGAEVFPLHIVDKIEPLDSTGKGGYRVYFRELNIDRKHNERKGEVIGKKVIVAAGTLGSAEILLRSKQQGTLSNLGAMLGRRFSGNGDFLLAGTYNSKFKDKDDINPRDVDPVVGPSITAGADFSTADNHIFIEDLGFPDPFMWFLEGTLPTTARLRDIFRFFGVYLLRSLGLTSTTPANASVGDILRGGITPKFLPYLGMGTDAADGELRLSGDDIDIKWSHSKSRRMFKEMEDGLRALSAGIKGDYRTSPLWAWPIRKLVTAHPLGGCVMNDNASQGVVNEWGEVWGHPNLYVADGSIIPTALSVNPSATIGALAERIGEHIVQTW
ncbi:MAG TPA: GMC family oxidoreductase [Blastocatellia bacterium]|nr:GMC family oxidoreductase [Blastocatellia bacterium]